MMTYIAIVYFIAIARELFVSIRTKQSISAKTMLVTAFAPITFPLLMLMFAVMAYKEAKEEMAGN